MIKFLLNIWIQKHTNVQENKKCKVQENGDLWGCIRLGMQQDTVD